MNSNIFFSGTQSSLSRKTSLTKQVGRRNNSRDEAIPLVDLTRAVSNATNTATNQMPPPKVTNSMVSKTSKVLPRSNTAL